MGTRRKNNKNFNHNRPANDKGQPGITIPIPQFVENQETIVFVAGFAFAAGMCAMGWLQKLSEQRAAEQAELDEQEEQDATDHRAAA